MYTAIAAAILLATAPASPTDSSFFDVSDAEVTASDDLARLTTFDADGEITAEVIVWSDDDGRAHVVAVWPDGLYLEIVEDGLVESSDMADAAERMAALETALAAWEDVSTKEWLACGASAAVTAGVCATAATGWGVLACTGAALRTGIDCGAVLNEGLAG